MSRARARPPAHTHPDGEEIYVVSGKGRLDDLPIAAGDFIWTPPGEAHVLYAQTEVVIHMTLPGPIVITE
jgi:quercetin dioxygenase-like cupin family protein